MAHNAELSRQATEEKLIMENTGQRLADGESAPVESDDLLCCPWCESEGDYVRRTHGGYDVKCVGCGAIAPDHGLDYATKSDAAARWNTRAT